MRDKDEGSYDVERSAQRSLARLGNTEARVGAVREELFRASLLDLVSAEKGKSIRGVGNT